MKSKEMLAEGHSEKKTAVTTQPISFKIGGVSPLFSRISK
jgi:hypothetical protein